MHLPPPKESPLDHLLDELTDAQRQAVVHFEGPLLILAGPGSGKTRVVTHRIAWLLGQGVPGSQILALTFTNKAADEMRARVERLADDRSVWLGTFHRFCAQLLRKYAPLVGIRENYSIYDTSDSGRALRRVIQNLQIETMAVTPDAIAGAISWAKNNLISPDQYKPRQDSLLGMVVPQVYTAYQAYLTSCNAVDFDDLLLHVAVLLRENPEIRHTLDQRYRFVLVDEYQDTNLAQYAIARALSIDHPNLAVTGDPDQSIYGWRGANLNNILDFEKDFPEVRVVRLEQNYRSTQRILRVADQLIAHNLHRKEKSLYTENGLGSPVRLVMYPDHKEEALGIATRIAADIHSGRRRARDFAIFYRVNALSRALEFALREVGVPYQMIKGLEFFHRKEIKDVLGYLHLLNNPLNDLAFLRIINTPTRGIGKTTLDRLTEHGAAHGLSLLEAARVARQIRSLSKRSASLVDKFVVLYDRVVSVAEGPIEEILGLVLSETEYQERLKASDSEEDQQRLANIEELLTVARDFDERHPGHSHLEAFLEESSLVNDTDGFEDQVDRVTLMTLHSSKGLEFPVIYLIAVEEGLLPHERSSKDPRQLEEERRLMFVGITRAQEELQLSVARYRDFRGQRKMTITSPFLMELPREELDVESPADEPAFVSEPTFEEPVFSATAPASRQSTGSLAASLTTAADLANGGTSETAVSPDVFRQGMVVWHPKYGVGRIAALSGAGANRQATIDFPHPTGRRKFRLSESSIRPLTTSE